MYSVYKDENDFLFKSRNIIITGENGSGKSLLLDKFSRQLTKKGYLVLGISNSINDKFTNKSRNFLLFSQRNGRSSTETQLKKSLLNITNIDYDSKAINSHITKSLSYSNFKKKMGISFGKIPDSYKEDIYSIEELSIEEKDLIIKTIELTKEINYGEIAWFIDDENEYGMWDYLFLNRIESLLNLIKYERILTKNNIIERINIHVEKGGNSINLLAASSGEISLLKMLVIVSLNIRKEKFAVVIDEPENSLHPAWQRTFLDNLTDIFHFFSPTIVVATHSPFLLSGAIESDLNQTDFTSGGLSIYGKKSFDELNLIQHESEDIEAIIWDYFKITTPKSNFLSRHFVKLLNKLSEKKISINDFELEYESFYHSSYSKEQKETLEHLLQIAYKISMGLVHD